MVDSFEGAEPDPLSLGQLLLRAFRWFDEGIVAGQRAAGWPQLTRAHSMVFAGLGRRGARMSDLARRTGVSRQAVHKLVHELIDMGLVELRDDETNRSAKVVVPTGAGRQSIEIALGLFAQLEAELTARIGPADVRELRRILERSWGPPATDLPSASAPAFASGSSAAKRVSGQ